MLLSLLRFGTQVFPPSFFCPGCHLPTWKTVCDPCQKSLYWNHKILPAPFPGLEGAAPLLYSFHRTQKLIRHWKEHQGTELRRILMKMPMPLQNQLIENHFFMIVPIPQDQSRATKRGHESAFEVARFFSERLKVPILPLLKLKNKRTRRQARLNRFDREFSQNPFQINPEFPDSGAICAQLQEMVFQGKEIRILLIDDIMTSGSTLSRAEATIHELLPHAKIWVGAIGIRPNVLIQASEHPKHQSLGPKFLTQLKTPENPPLQFESGWQWFQAPLKSQMHQR